MSMSAWSGEAGYCQLEAANTLTLSRLYTVHTGPQQACSLYSVMEATLHIYSNSNNFFEVHQTSMLKKLSSIQESRTEMLRRCDYVTHRVGLKELSRPTQKSFIFIVFLYCFIVVNLIFFCLKK